MLRPRGGLGGSRAGRGLGVEHHSHHGAQRRPARAHRAKFSHAHEATRWLAPRSKRARHRVQLAKERQDLTKIVAFVQNHNDAVRRKFVAFEEYLEAVRDQKVTVKNVYTTEAMQRGDKEKMSGGWCAAGKLKPEAKWAGGKSNGWPERNCCACGREAQT